MWVVDTKLTLPSGTIQDHRILENQSENKVDTEEKRLWVGDVDKVLTTSLEAMDPTNGIM